MNELVFFPTIYFRHKVKDLLVMPITISLCLSQVGHVLAIPKHHSSPTTNPLGNSSPLTFIGLLFCYSPSITRTRMKSSG